MQDGHPYRQAYNLVVKRYMTIARPCTHLNQSYGFSKHLYVRFSFCAAIFLAAEHWWVDLRAVWIRQSGSNSSVKLVYLYARVWRSSLADNTACFHTLCLACTHRPGIGLPNYSYYTWYSLETVCGLFRCTAYIGCVGACSIHSMTNHSLNFTSYLLTWSL